MQSKFHHLKSEVIEMRKNGQTLAMIRKKYPVPKGTLSGWFKEIILTDNQKEIIKKNWIQNLGPAREKAGLWHKNAKKERMKVAEVEAGREIDRISIDDRLTVELALAMLYLGEGFKTNSMGIGNSDPLILRFYIKAMIRCFQIDINSITCYLHLRADQDELKIKQYWATELGIHINNFRKTSFDKRTIGRTTYGSYKGICIVCCGNLAIQRKLIYLCRTYCKKVIDNLY